MYVQNKAMKVERKAHIGRKYKNEYLQIQYFLYFNNFLQRCYAHSASQQKIGNEHVYQTVFFYF